MKRGLKGELSSLSLTDLMQWIDSSRKTGVLFVAYEALGRCFCFDEGKLLFAASKKDGERFEDFVSKEASVDVRAIRNAVKSSAEEGRSIVDYMVESKLIPMEFLNASLQQLAETSIVDVLSWPNGTFEFIEELPKLMKGSPIKLPTNFIIFESVRKFDELKKSKRP